MFGRIAPLYDALNHLLSFNRDRAWRRRMVGRVLETRREGAGGGRMRLLDVCAGTGDVAVLLAASLRSADATITGLDFSREMLAVARRKSARLNPGSARPEFVEGDALRMPFASGRFDVATMAFGLRNLADPPSGLRELARVLRPGGEAAILEFHLPPSGLLRLGYGLYLHGVLPLLGNLVSRTKAYRYLSRSIAEFAGAEEVGRWMREAGFEQVRRENMWAGAVVLHRGVVPPDQTD